MSAGLRTAKQGADVTGGITPSKRSPVSGSSAETMGALLGDLATHVRGHHAHNALRFGGADALAAIGPADDAAVDPQAPIRD